jgi:hypothetical protein
VKPHSEGDFTLYIQLLNELRLNDLAHNPLGLCKQQAARDLLSPPARGKSGRLP